MWTTTTKKDVGIVYVLLIHLEGKDLVKIGITSRKIEDRVTEILTGIWKKYRRYPYCYPKRFKSTDKYKEYEEQLLKYFKDKAYTTEHTFGGCTEFIDVGLDEVVRVYDQLLSTGKIDVQSTEEECKDTTR